MFQLGDKFKYMGGDKYFDGQGVSEGSVLVINDIDEGGYFWAGDVTINEQDIARGVLVKIEDSDSVFALEAMLEDAICPECHSKSVVDDYDIDQDCEWCAMRAELLNGVEND